MTLGYIKNRFVDVNKIRDVVATEEHLRKAKEIARASITVVKKDGILPLMQFNDKRILFITMVDSNDPYCGNSFVSDISKRYDNISFERVDLRSTDEELNAILSKLKGFDLVIVTAYVRVRAYQASLALPEKLSRLLKQILVSGKPVVLISLGTPYIVIEYPNVKAYICSYSDAQPVVEATAVVLFGEISPQGKLPINIPGFATLGTGLSYPQATLRYGYPDEAGFDPAKSCACFNYKLPCPRDSFDYQSYQIRNNHYNQCHKPRYENIMFFTSIPFHKSSVKIIYDIRCSPI